MSPDSRFLVVMRHSQAEAQAVSDDRRALTAQGRADSAAAGRWLAGQGLRPDRALVSAALRTAQTWEAVAEAAGWSVPAELDPGLYDAEPDTVLDLLRALDDDVRTAMVLGHNPTMASVAQLLDDGEGDPGAENAMATGFPTSAAAVFEVAGEWGGLGTARLVGFHVARG